MVLGEFLTAIMDADHPFLLCLIAWVRVLGSELDVSRTPDLVDECPCQDVACVIKVEQGLLFGYEDGKQMRLFDKYEFEYVVEGQDCFLIQPEHWNGVLPTNKRAFEEG